MNEKTEGREKFRLRARLLAIANIKNSRKALEEAVEKTRWLSDFIQPSIRDLNIEENRLQAEITVALKANQITIDDILDISPY